MTVVSDLNALGDPRLGTPHFQDYTHEALLLLAQAIDGSIYGPAHATTHARSGSDPIDGDQVDIDYTATAYVPTTVGGLTTNAEHLSSHLKGMDTKLGTLASDLVKGRGTGFQATRTTNTTATWNVASTILFNNIVYQTENYYNAATGIFQPLEQGFYLMYAAVSASWPADVSITNFTNEATFRIYRNAEFVAAPRSGHLPNSGPNFNLNAMIVGLYDHPQTASNAGGRNTVTAIMYANGSSDQFSVKYFKAAANTGTINILANDVGLGQSTYFGALKLGGF
jgi:hypothetical protein